MVNIALKGIFDFLLYYVILFIPGRPNFTENLPFRVNSSSNGNFCDYGDFSDFCYFEDFGEFCNFREFL